MKISELYASPFLKPEDLGGRAHRVKIAEVTISAFTDPKTRKEQRKAVLTLVGRKKAFILNRTQANAAAAALGDELQTWPGGELIIAPGQTANGQDTIVVTGLPAHPDAADS